MERSKGFYGICRTLELVVDGVSIGGIKHKQKEVFEIPADAREIWGKMDWATTERLDISGYQFSKETVVFQSRFTWNTSKNLGVDKMPFEVFLAGSESSE